MSNHRCPHDRNPLTAESLQNLRSMCLQPIYFFLVEPSGRHLSRAHTLA
jgi:hypothetical protein